MLHHCQTCHHHNRSWTHELCHEVIRSFAMFISALRAYLVDIGGTRSQVDLLQATSEESTELQLIFSGLPSFWAPKNRHIWIRSVRAEPKQARAGAWAVQSYYVT